VVKPLHLCSPKAPRSRKRRRDSCFHNLNGYRIDRILTQHPDDPHAHLFLGDLYAIQDDYTTASTHYEQAIARDPTLAHGYFSLGVVYDKLGKVEQSLQMYERAATLADWHQPYLNNLAYQYLQHQDYDKARAT
jgi:Flp pilus assembly protein TadD